MLIFIYRLFGLPSINETLANHINIMELKLLYDYVRCSFHLVSLQSSHKMEVLIIYPTIMSKLVT